MPRTRPPYPPEFRTFMEASLAQARGTALKRARRSRALSTRSPLELGDGDQRSL
jgi:hypothetical protein